MSGKEELMAQYDPGLIYGELKLKNGRKFKGQIRWGAHEAMWEDVFQAVKKAHPTQNLLTEAEVRFVSKRQGDFKFDFMQLWEDKGQDLSFAFRCQFGDIHRLSVLPDNSIVLALKNGDAISLRAGGMLAPDQPIVVVDGEYGKLSVKFRELEYIVFQSPPPQMSCIMGVPIFAKVLTTGGTFEGFITWDEDERLEYDIISGRKDGVKYDYAFKDISELTVHSNGSLIKFMRDSTSENSLFLNKHDDVSQGNHGITIHHLSFGKLKINWENFISARFYVPLTSPKAYREFKVPKLIKGTVLTKSGASYEGQIIYDLDEIYDLEMLNGKNNEFEYFIPFKKIDKIIPQNDRFSLVLLKDGQQFVLGENSDVDSGNHGLVMKLEEGEAEFIEWNDINMIQLE